MERGFHKEVDSCGWMLLLVATGMMMHVDAMFSHGAGGLLAFHSPFRHQILWHERYERVICSMRYPFAVLA